MKSEPTSNDEAFAQEDSCGRSEGGGSDRGPVNGASVAEGLGESSGAPAVCVLQGPVPAGGDEFKGIENDSDESPQADRGAGEKVGPVHEGRAVGEGPKVGARVRVVVRRIEQVSTSPDEPDEEAWPPTETIEEFNGVVLAINRMVYVTRDNGEAAVVYPDSIVEVYD